MIATHLALTLLLATPGPSAVSSPSEMIFEERFEGGDAAGRWTVGTGASVGAGPASTVEFANGALCLRATRETQLWKSVSRDVSVDGASWIRVSARMRTEGVDAAGARFANCNVYVRFGSAGLVALPQFRGTQPWTLAARRYEVPQGVESISVGCFLSLPGEACFDDVQVERIPAFRVTRGEHYTYHSLPGDDISEAYRAANEKSLALVASFLDVALPETVDYYKYPSVDVKSEYTGNSGNAHVHAGAIHSIHPTDQHEIVHVLAKAWGSPPALLAEGLAVHLSGAWQRVPVEVYARAILRDGRWIPLEEILDTALFRERDDLVTYAEAGALARWIELDFGKAKLRAVYGSVNNELSHAANLAAFEKSLGLSLSVADERLRASLGVRNSGER